jgi:hypothetical protein
MSLDEPPGVRLFDSPVSLLPAPIGWLRIEGSDADVVGVAVDGVVAEGVVVVVTDGDCAFEFDSGGVTVVVVELGLVVVELGLVVVELGLVVVKSGLVGVEPGFVVEPGVTAPGPGAFELSVLGLVCA